ncbi:hypothetical protein ACH4VM_39280 [Streptomyces sp. NPDC020792]|uniref:hypothetical protein n=1 Tax=Streptomyces sp. NPDC020792 TaxID=3365089 RepID=UPI0037AE8C52
MREVWPPSCGDGAKGPHVYHWAAVRLPAVAEFDYQGEIPHRMRWALARRSISKPDEIAYYLAYVPLETMVRELVRVAWARWAIEETFQLGKTFTGLDEGQVTCWNSWMRWSLFSLIAAAVLALTAAATTTVGPAGPARLVPLTCPELVRLLRAFVLTPPVRETEHVLHWIAWRRHHQAVAQACHQRRHVLQDQP